MKLVSCYVSSFGKLKDFSYDFTGGLNTVKEDNGWGKSTLATFTKAMFYGLDGSAKRTISENERKKYKPWNSTETFGGSINFEWGGKEFKIERFFGNKETDDTLRLYDVKTGKSFTNTEDLGKRIFEIDEEGFLSTTYFSQKDFEIKSNTSITAKFNSLCEADDADSFDSALSKITQKAKTYKYSGDRGLINDCKRELRSVSEEIERAGHASNTAKILKNEVAEISGEVEELKKQSSELAEQVAAAGRAEAVAVKRARLNELLKEKDTLIKEKLNVDSVLNGKLPTDSEITAYTGFADELVKVSSNAKLISDELSVMQGKETPTNKGFSKRQTIASIAICLLFFIEGISTIWFNLVLGIVGFALFLITAVLILVAFSSKSSVKPNNEFAQLAEMRKTRLNEYRELENDYISKLNAFLSSYSIPVGLDYRSSVLYVKSAADKYIELTEKLQSVEKMIDAFNGDPTINENSVGVGDVMRLKAQLFDVQNAYTKKAGILASKLASVKAYEELADKQFELESKKLELEEKLEQYKVEHDTLIKTAEFLKKADENLKVKYRAPLQDSLNKYLKLIAGGEISAIIDIDLNVTIEEKFGEKHTDYYSKGYQNLFEICKRFALTDVLFTGEKPFIILDDPFFNLDDKKVKSAVTLIEKLSEEYQILYFICHESRRPDNAV